MVKHISSHARILGTCLAAALTVSALAGCTSGPTAEHEATAAAEAFLAALRSRRE